MKERGILFSAPMVRALLDGSKTQTRRVVKQRWPQLSAEPYYPTGKVIADLPIQPGAWMEFRHRQQDEAGFTGSPASTLVLCPYGKPEDRLWVRETWAHDALSLEECRAAHEDLMGGMNHYGPYYRATEVAPDTLTWRPSIHMPRWASRITLEIVSVRVERLHDISEADAVAEGCKPDPYPGPWWQGYRRMADGHLLHQQAIGEEPPDWMVEPHKMRSLSHLDRSAKDGYRLLWTSINGLESWDANPWVWVVEFKKITPQGGDTA